MHSEVYIEPKSFVVIITATTFTYLSCIRYATCNNHASLEMASEMAAFESSLAADVRAFARDL